MKINGHEIEPFANLTGAKLRRADLTEADLTEADLSGALGLLSQSEWMLKNFKRSSEGYIIYKDIESTFYDKPQGWKFAKNSILTENCNPNRTDACGCGVNFATLDWIKNNSNNEAWQCLIKWQDLPGIVVPYNTDGKARCERLKLIKPYKEE